MKDALDELLDTCKELIARRDEVSWENIDRDPGIRTIIEHIKNVSEFVLIRTKERE